MRLLTRCEWLMLRPALGCLPQISQIFDMVIISPYEAHFCKALLL